MITGTTAPTDKKVRCEAARVREALLEGEIKKVNLVKGKAMLADVLTKRKVELNSLLHNVQTGESLDKLGYCSTKRKKDSGHREMEDGCHLRVKQGQ